MAEMSRRTEDLQEYLRVCEGDIARCEALVRWTLTAGHDWYESQLARTYLAAAKAKRDEAVEYMLRSMVQDEIEEVLV